MTTINSIQNGTGSAAAASAAAYTPRKRQKLTGRAFYEKLGSPKMVLAPMVDQSEFVWAFLPLPSKVFGSRFARRGVCSPDLS